MPAEAAAKVSFKYVPFFKFIFSSSACKIYCQHEKPYKVSFKYHVRTVFFSSKEPETEAVSDEELPAAQPADLGETESVSEDELPVESEKKKKGSKSTGKVEKRKSDTSSKNDFYCNCNALNLTKYKIFL